LPNSRKKCSIIRKVISSKKRMLKKRIMMKRLRACTDVEVNHLLIVCLSVRFTSYDPF